MADISKVRVGSASYDIKDSIAREGVERLDSEIYGRASAEGSFLLAIPGDFKGNAIDITEFTGNSAVVNQLVDISQFFTAATTPVAGVYRTRDTTAQTYTFNGTSTEAVVNSGIVPNTYPQLTKGHTYLWITTLIGGSVNISGRTTTSINGGYVICPRAIIASGINTGVTSVGQSYAAVFTQSGTPDSIAIAYGFDANVVFNNAIFQFMLIDLTLAGLTTAEMADVATAKAALKHKGMDVDSYIPYNASTLMDSKPTKLYSRNAILASLPLKSIGAYTFTGSETWNASTSDRYTCAIINSLAKAANNAAIANFFVTGSGLTLSSKDGVVNGNGYIALGDGANIFLHDTANVTSTSKAASFMAGRTIYYELANASSAISQAVIDGLVEHEYDLTIPYLKSVGSVQDESKAEGSKVKQDDLATIKSGGFAAYGGYMIPFTYSGTKDTNQKPNLLCDKYQTVNAVYGSTSYTDDMPDKSITVIVNSNYLFVKDSALGSIDNLVGTLLSPKATPTDFTDPISLPQRVRVKAGGVVEVVCANLVMPSAVMYRWQTLVDVPTAVSELSNDADYATVSYVDQRIDDLPEPMVFKGSLGVGGTITTLPTASADNKGFTYKVITAGTYQGLACKVGDAVISDGSAWTLIPSGDEPSGTVTSVGLQAGSGSNLSVSGSPVTSSGTLTISVASGYSIPSTAQQTTWSGKQDAIPGLDYDSSDGTFIGSAGYMVVCDDGNEANGAPRPNNSIDHRWTDLDLYIYRTGFTVKNADGHDYRQYSFPHDSGTLATTKDIGLTVLDLREYPD